MENENTDRAVRNIEYDYNDLISDNNGVLCPECGHNCGDKNGLVEFHSHLGKNHRVVATLKNFPRRSFQPSVSPPLIANPEIKPMAETVSKNVEGVKTSDKSDYSKRIQELNDRYQVLLQPVILQHLDSEFAVGVKVAHFMFQEAFSDILGNPDPLTVKDKSE